MKHHAVSLAMLAACAVAPVQAADVYYEQVTVTSTGQAAPGPGVKSRVWHAGRKMRLQVGDAATGPALILRLDEGRAIRLDPARSTATLVDVERLRAQSRLDLAVAGDLLGASEDGALRTSSLPGMKKIASYSCRGVRISGPASAASLDLYLTTELPIGIETFTDFLEWSGASTSLGAVMDEVRRLRGFPLETRARVTIHGDPVVSVSTVTSVKVGPVAPALFEVPKDFRVVAETVPLPQE